MISNKMQYVCIYLTFVIIFSSSLVVASEPIVSPPAIKICSESDTNKCAIGLYKGDIAPFTGQLLTENLAIELGIQAKFAQKQCEIDHNFLKNTQKIKIKYLEDLHKADTRAYKNEIKLLNKVIQKKVTVPLLEKPVVVAIISVASTIITMHVMYKYIRTYQK